MMRISGELPDIYSTTYYTPGHMGDEGDFLDLSGYDFMDNYTPSRLRDVSYNGGIYMLPMGYSAIGITYNKTLLDANGWTLPTNLDELATLKDEVEAAGYVFSRCQLEYPGFSFQFMCAIASISFLSNLEIAIGRVLGLATRKLGDELAQAGEQQSEAVVLRGNLHAAAD